MLAPTAYSFPFGWNSAQRIACKSSSSVTGLNAGRASTPFPGDDDLAEELWCVLFWERKRKEIENTYSWYDTQYYMYDYYNASYEPNKRWVKTDTDKKMFFSIYRLYIII